MTSLMTTTSTLADLTGKRASSWAWSTVNPRSLASASDGADQSSPTKRCAPLRCAAVWVA